MRTQTSPIAETAEATVRRLEAEHYVQFDEQRRYNLLRVIVPAILILATVALPFAIVTDILGSTYDPITASSTQNIVVLVGTVTAFLALRRKNIALAALALFLGVVAIIGLLLFNDFVLANPISLGTMPELSLLLVPIALISVLAGPRAIIATTAGTIFFTIVVLTFSAKAADYQQFVVASSGGLVL